MNLELLTRPLPAGLAIETIDGRVVSTIADIYAQGQGVDLCTEDITIELTFAGLAVLDGGTPVGYIVASN